MSFLSNLRNLFAVPDEPPPPQAEPQAEVPDVFAPDTAALARVESAELRGILAGVVRDVERLGTASPLGRAMRAHAMGDTQAISTLLDPQFRPYSRVSIQTLRTLAETYDVLGACLAHLKSEVIKVPLKFVPKDDKDKRTSTIRQCREAREWFDTPGGLGGVDEERAVFEGKILDDLLIIGVAAIAFEFETVGALYEGKPDSAFAIDASTIRPLLTPQGFTPGADQPAYQQWVMGQPIEPAFTRRDLWYKGLPIFARTKTPYPTSAVELLVLKIYMALKSDEWNREFFVSGNTPDQWMKMPENMAPDQAIEWLDLFDEQVGGATGQRRKIKVTPGDITGTQSRREADFQSFDEWLATCTCSMCGVNPASIGHNGGQYEANQEAAMEGTEDRVGQLRQWRLSLYNNICARKGWDRVKVVDDLPDGETKKERAERHAIEIQSGQRTINETRQERGDDPVAGGDTLLVSSSTQPLFKIVPPADPVLAEATQPAPVETKEVDDEEEEDE